MNVKSATSASAKWATRAQAATPDYTAGVQNTAVQWAGPTAAAAPNWAQGVQDAATNGRFASGVSAAGDATWRAGAAGKGSQRYGQGVAGATSKYQTNVAPFLAVLQNMTLPPRFPKGSPSNAARSQAVATALRAAKVGK